MWWTFSLLRAAIQQNRHQFTSHVQKSAKHLYVFHGSTSVIHFWMCVSGIFLCVCVCGFQWAFVQILKYVNHKHVAYVFNKSMFVYICLCAWLRNYRQFCKWLSSTNKNNYDKKYPGILNWPSICPFMPHSINVRKAIWRSKLICNEQNKLSSNISICRIILMTTTIYSLRI